MDGTTTTVDGYIPSLYLLIDLVTNFTISHPENPFVALNDAAFAAQFVTSTYPNQLNTTWGQEAFDFCEGCAMISFSVEDYFNQAISQYYYELMNGSCADIFNTANW